MFHPGAIDSARLSGFASVWHKPLPQIRAKEATWDLVETQDRIYTQMRGPLEPVYQQTLALIGMQLPRTISFKIWISPDGVGDSKIKVSRCRNCSIPFSLSKNGLPLLAFQKLVI